MVAHNRAVARSCLRETGPLFLHADTVSVARDHEALRIALGVSKVSWLGLSYGTQLGAKYAQLYPNRTRAMVLDAALDHSLSEVLLTADAISTVEEAFNRFADWCDTAPDCVLRGQDVRAVYDDTRPARPGESDPGRRGPAPCDRGRHPDEQPDLAPREEPQRARRASFTWPVFSRGPQASRGRGRLVLRVGRPRGPDRQPLRPDRESLRGLRLRHPHLRRHAAADRDGPAAGARTCRADRSSGRTCCASAGRSRSPTRSARLDVKGVPTLIVHANHDPSVSYQWAFEPGSPDPRQQRADPHR